MIAAQVGSATAAGLKNHFELLQLSLQLLNLANARNQIKDPAPLFATCDDLCLITPGEDW